MKILEGISDGALFQREKNNLCRVQFEAEADGDIKCSLGTVKRLDNGLFELTGIPVGGPYNITLSDNSDSVSLCDIYVGDLWLLGGQSNMDGAGKIDIADYEYAENPSPRVRALFMDEVWRPAKYDMHNKIIAKEPAYVASVDRWLDSLKNSPTRDYASPPYCHLTVVGPGVAFAKEMYRLTEGVPQGLIPAAVGGAPISTWQPSDDGTPNYYDAALHRIKLAGNNIKGMFWAQGENHGADGYPEKIEIIRNGIFEQTGIEKLPTVSMQSFIFTTEGTKESAFRWSAFREMQRKMSLEHENFTTIATNDCGLWDGIHLDSPSQEKTGIRGARAMLYLTDGIGFAQPELDKVIVEEDAYRPDTFSLIRVRYKNLSGALCSAGVPTGFDLGRAGDSENVPDKFKFCHVSLHQNEVHLRIERPASELSDFALWYGFGNYCYCNVSDGEGRALPSMGPINLAEYIK